MAACFMASPASGLNVWSHCNQVLLVNINPMTANVSANLK